MNKTKYPKVRISKNLDDVLNSLSTKLSKQAGHKVSKVQASGFLANEIRNKEINCKPIKKKKKIVGFDFEFNI